MSTDRDAGFQALQQRNADAAIPLLESACRQDPNDFDAFLYLGAAYGQTGRKMDAVMSVTKAVQLQPGNPQARYNLGIAMEALEATWPSQAANHLTRYFVSLARCSPMRSGGVPRHMRRHWAR